MTAHTARSIRTGLAGLLLVAASLLVAAGLTFVATVGVAAPAPVDGAVDPSMALAVPPIPPPAPGAGVVRDASPGGSAGSASTAATAGSPPAAEPTADDVGQLWRRGEYLGAGLLALFLLLSFALKVDPKRAFVYTGILGGLAGVVDLIALGQTPNVGMLVGAAGVAIALIMRSPLPLPRPAAPRPPERGSAASPLLVILASAALPIAAAAAWSCTSARQLARSTASSLVDCTTSTARAHAAEYGSLLEAAIRAATSPEGQVDRAALKGAVQGLALETGWCAAERTVARILSSFPVLRVAPGGYDPAASLREAWAAVRSERWEGKRFRVGEGPVL
jgi:hypothetical protein